MVEQCFCEKCKKTQNKKEFYKSNNLEKYPDGRLNQCKKCITMHVDNWDPDTFTPILKECDVPYIPEEWQKLLATYAKDRASVSGTSIIGRYLSKMQLKQFKDYRWGDSQFLQELSDHKLEEAMKRQGYGAAEIAQVIEENKNLSSNAPPPLTEKTSASYEEDYFSRNDTEEDDIAGDITDEEKTYLRLKWGKAYKPEEWVRLEQLYQEMKESYDIQGAGHEDTLKMVCKTSLKSNQLLDMGDRP